jgi:hypothetical protein
VIIPNFDDDCLKSFAALCNAIFRFQDHHVSGPVVTVATLMLSCTYIRAYVGNEFLPLLVGKNLFGANFFYSYDLFLFRAFNNIVPHLVFWRYVRPTGTKVMTKWYFAVCTHVVDYGS